MRHAFFVLMLLVVAACSGGGGCSSGCAGCGITPLPAGFPQASVIADAASVRVTRPGLDFIAANLGTVAAKALQGSSGVLHFPIPSSTQQQSILGFTITIKICPNGPDPNSNPPKCTADIDIGNAHLHLDAITPHSLKISGTIPVRLLDLPINASVIGDFDVGMGEPVNGNGCNGGTPTVDWTAVPVDIELPLVQETRAPREGYTKIDADNAVTNVNLDKNKIFLCKDCGIFGGVCNGILGFVKDQAAGQLIGGVSKQLKSQLQNNTCTKPQPTLDPACPVGSHPDDPDPAKAKKCMFDSDPKSCVPMLLGMDGHMNLAAALQKISPGTQGGLDLVLAAGGDMDPAPDCQPNNSWTANGGCQTDANPPYDGHTPNGMTLGFLGGMLPQPQSTCVPVVDNPIPQNIPVPDELTRDGISPWPQGDPGPDVDLALAGRYLNYAATAAYNSGVLCLGVSTEQFQALNSGLLSVIIPSLQDLTFEPGRKSRAAGIAITTRPQKPPTVKIGNGTDIKTDPLLTITLPRFAIDFYVWSEDRYVRAFTYTADLTIPVNLQTGKDPKTNPNGGILPVLGDLKVASGGVTNSDLLWEQPQAIADSLTGLLGSIVGKFLGNGFKPIDLSNALKNFGVGITIPAGGFRKLTKGSDDFLAMFADLELTSGQMMMRTETRATIVDRVVHPEAMTLAGADRARFPKLRAALASPQDDGKGAVEYSWWIDDQPHAPWTTEHDATIDPAYLFLQGKHVLYVSSRLVGHPETEDETPAEAPFVIDVLPPAVWLDTSKDGVRVGAYDYVSPESALKARWRLTDGKGVVGAWTQWAPLATSGDVETGGATAVDVQVVDESENVGSVSQALVRGRPDPSLGSGGSACSCNTPGASGDMLAGGGAATIAAAVALLLAFAARRRRRATAAGFSPLPCSARACGLALGSLCTVAATSQGCSCGDSSAASATGCGSDCNHPCGTPNAQGLIGAYTSVAVANDGTIWVAGYNDADVTNGLLYGDLVAGKYDSGQQKVRWTTVDGLPALDDGAMCAPNDPTTWRHGLTDPGPDVGLWTSIAIAGDGSTPIIGYYDSTNHALKFASSPDGGSTWTSHIVMSAASSDIGRYAKLLVVAGKPVVAFLIVEKGTGGYARSRVEIATGTSSVPQSAAEWTMQDVIVDNQSPCRAKFCGDGQVCVESTTICQPTVSGCTPSDCGKSGSGLGSAPQACVTIQGKPTCSNIQDDTYIDTYPDAAGDYVAMASGPQGVGVVVYDRTRGNLVGAANQGGKWVAQILDGQVGENGDPKRKDTGDVGVGASLAITPNGDWHVSYVNGFTEALQYLNVPGGSLSKPLAPEVVDDGLKLGGQAYADGQHIVGDDSSITLDASGAVRVVYQDATAGTLHEATGAPGAGGKHTWTVKALSQPAGRFAGFFPHYVAQAQSVANWYRATDHSQSPPVVTGDVAFVAP